jgi:hypothetical protein
MRGSTFPGQYMTIVGTNAEPILENLPETFLIIDDGPLIDRLTLPKRRKVTRFDPSKHSFNPLKDIDYRKARNFISLLDAVFPEGAETLTRKNANFAILKALLKEPDNLTNLLSPSEDPGEKDAYQKIETLLISPVLKNVLCKPKNFPLDGILIARLNRAELGDFDCFVLGNLLMSEYKGQVVVTDYGFYAAPFHMSLIREGRLTAQVNFLDELPEKIREQLLLRDKQPSHATFDDAEVLAIYSGHARGSVGFSDYISEAMK